MTFRDEKIEEVRCKLVAKSLRVRFYQSKRLTDDNGIKILGDALREELKERLNLELLEAYSRLKYGQH